jgi:hypothetical protein
VNNKKVFLAIISLIYVAVLVITFIYKANPYLWFDEAGQFWMSKGLNHYSDPLQPVQGIGAVIENNAYYNMDPGGFSVLLHFWSKISDSYIWLRLLPFLFLILTVAAFIYLFFKWTKNVFIAAMAGFIPLFMILVVNLGLELRAYSMEIAGTVIGLVAIESLMNKLSYKRLFLWGCVLAFFMTSRYAEIVIVFVYSLAILYLVFSSGLSMKQKITATIIYALPLAIILIFAYLFSLSVQNPAVNPIFYLPYLKYHSRLLLQPRHLIYLAALVAILISLLFSWRYSLLKRYRLLLFSTFTINGLFIILSYAGKHPWSLYSASCISLFLVTVICIAALVSEMLLPFFKVSRTKRYYFALPVLLLALFLRRDSFTSQERRENSYTSFKNTGTNYKHVYVGAWESPSIRYLFEYGKLKGMAKDFYPGNFMIIKSLRHNISADFDQYLQSFNIKPDADVNYQDFDLLIVPDKRPGFDEEWKLIDGTVEFYELRAK